MRIRFSLFALAGWLLLALRSGLALAADAPPAPAATLVPLKDFAKFAEFKQVEISPNGEYLATVFDEGDQDDLVTISLSDKKVLSRQQVGKGFRIPELWWVGPKRIVFTLAEQQGTLEQPARTGELLGVDADGTGQKYLFGYRANDTGGSHIKGAERRYASAYMINPLVDDPNYALISINDWEDGETQGRTEVARLNVNSGASTGVDTSPVPGYARFLADEKGIARFVVSTNAHNKDETYARAGAGAEWKRLDTGDLKGATIEPLSLLADGHRALLLSDENTETFCLFEQDLDTGEKKKLSCDAIGSVEGAIRSFDRAEAIGAYYDTAAPWERLLDSTHPDRERLARFQKSFPGQNVLPVSATRNGGLVVMKVFSDRNPGDYYLFTPKTLKAEYLASVRGALDPEQMAVRRPMDFQTRDGQTIHGFVTLPPGRTPKKLPLIVNPHGGPFTIRDTWDWDQDPAVLASRGYAVLQVNFRGSGGYGGNYYQAGRKGWDTVMINDITDATRDLIEQGVADGSRVCIFGGSFGGYAALMSAVREPDLYRCTIGYAGIYDLPSWRDDTDVTNSASGRTYVQEFIGESTERLKAASPLAYIDKLKAAVMIVHGALDLRVPVNQARALRKALEARKYPYEWLIKDDEGHGFYKPENKVELYTKLLAFIEKNIGPGAPVAAAASTDSAGK